MSVDTGKLVKNAFRVTRDRGITVLRVRVPGIPMDAVEEVNKIIAPLITGLEKEAGVPIRDELGGYPAAGTRNVSACIGSRVCPFANYDTTDQARKIERAIYPSDYHVKVAVSGCPNDCIKAHLQDVGVLGMVEPVYNHRCISCGACVENCRQRSAGALRMVNYKVERDAQSRCIGCGECILKCPNHAWSRGNNYYRVLILGRAGKKRPRSARTFLEWVDEAAVLALLVNLYNYIDKYIDRSQPKEHLGYMVDRTGMKVFRDGVLHNVTLGEKARVAKLIDFGSYF